MTSGVILDDFRVPTAQTNGQIAMIGTLYQKSWSGSDQPLLRSGPKLPPIKIPYYTYKLKRINGKVGIVSQELRYYTKAQPVPKRVRKADKGYHPYSMDLVSAYYPMASVQTYPGASVQTFGTSDGPSPPAWTANDTISLVGKLKEQINGSDFDMSILLGTSHQTVTLIANAAARIAKAYLFIKHGQFGKAARVFSPLDVAKGRRYHEKWRLHVAETNVSIRADKVSSAWLELQYGWRPLLQDVHNASESLANQIHAPARKVYRVKGRARQVAVNPSYPGCFSRTTGQILAVIAEQPSLLKKLGLTDPSSLAWELLPWSFVADWFIPIGDYLSARSFASGLKGTFVTTIVSRVAYYGQPKSYPPQWIVTGADGFKYKYLSLRRTIDTSLQVPLPEPKPLTQALSVQHCLNGIALLHQVMGGKRNHSIPPAPPAVQQRFTTWDGHRDFF